MRAAHGCTKHDAGYRVCIMMHMRITLNLDSELIERAKELTGIRETTALVHGGLQALLERSGVQTCGPWRRGARNAPDSAKKVAAAKVIRADTSV
jgi:hypothetical protein